MRNFLLASAALLFTSATLFARQYDNNGDFYFNINTSPSSWTQVPGTDDYFYSDTKSNLCYWKADNFSEFNKYFVIGIDMDDKIAAIYSTTPVPADINKLVVQKRINNATTVKSRKLIVSTDANFEVNCREYNHDTDQSTSTRDVYVISEPIADAYYRIEYNVGITKASTSKGSQYENISHLELYPKLIADSPQFFTTTNSVRIISETGELRTHACYYDTNGVLLPGNTECTATNLTEGTDYETNPVYNSSAPESTIRVLYLPETYSAANDVDAKYLTVWAQTYKDGELSEMVTRTYGEGGNIFTDIHEIFPDAPGGDGSTRYFDLQGNQIKSAENLPAGTLYIRIDSNGARKLSR